ncbi:glycoside hydrolase family 2 protein [Paenibacillus sp. KS-LC4]|uniref:beta-mannosidase n=1 Tax=Paenibacillus sp. KS-LC4 TaxID=2979727 RepID=UPI0030CA6862
MKITDWRLQHFEVGEKPPLQVAAPGLDDRFWMTANVPGDVHSTLIDRRIIEHPYFGHNDIKCRWIEQKEWWYRAQFDYEIHERHDGHGERHELIFEGLDTFATIFVNGLEIGTAENMHRIYVFDVTRVMRPGKNAIAVRFDPLHLHHQDKEQFQWSSYTKERPWLRKAAMNFGWDWGPRMVTVGIWGGVRLERRRVAKLDSVFVQTLSAGKEAAALRVAVDAVAYHKQAQLTAEIKLFTREGEVAASAAISVKGGRETAAELVVKQPQLWWSHDLGEPYLYELEVQLLAAGEQVDSYRKRCGIRTIELQLEDKAGKPAFAFLLNGVKLFAKGSNWIPADSFIGAVKDKRYTDLIELAVDSNMNMLRIWAGGIYEKDVFYEECDRLGVLVWQDFAFANALFPDFNRNFMENVRQEAIDNVKRLRNHPSLALWCGNNEIDWLYDMKSAGGDITCPFYGESIYHELLPEVLEQYDSSRPYWPSSPYGGNDANDPDVGDRHNWQVWHGSVYPRKFGEAPLLDYSIEGVTFKNYKKDFTLFSSEFGMHASANRYTLERYIPEGEFYWGSVELAHRNKDTNHQKGILLMEGYTGIPQNIEEYMNFSMLTQAEGLKYGIEHYRRNKHRTSGALVWQHNDSWPGTSWSLIDYELLPKASFYYAKKFYHPLLLSLDYEPGQPLCVWAVNDRLSAHEGEVLFQCFTLDGALVYEQSFDVKLPPNTAIQLVELAEAEVLGDAAPEQVIVKLSAPLLDAPDNYYYLRDHRELSLPNSTLAATFNEQEQTITIVASGGVARLVKITVKQGNVRFSDNYFDLLPGELVTVTLQQADGQPLRSETLEVSALNADKADIHFN